MRRPTPIQDAIRKVLREARTAEPYPPHVSWQKIARSVYGRMYADSADIRNVQQAVDRMYDVDTTYFEGNSRRAGAYLLGTSEERWLSRRLRLAVPEARYLSDASKYRPPTPAEILTTFVKSCHEDNLRGIDLRKLVEIVNKHCSTNFDVSEVMWWRVGLENRRAEERRTMLTRMHRHLTVLRDAKEHEEKEARMVTKGPYRFDPEGIDCCPLCHREIETRNAITFDARQAHPRAARRDQAMALT